MPPRKEEENRPVIGTGSPTADRFLNEPFLPKIGRTLTAMFTPQAGSPPPMPAGVAAIPQNASASRLNPVPFLQSLNPLANTPLIGGLAQGRGPRQEAPTPSVPVFPSGTPRIGFDIYPTAPQMPPTMPSQQPTQVASVNPRPATADDLDAFYRRGAYAPQPVARVAQPTPQRTAIQTPYGTIYATAEQASNLSAAASRPVDQRSTRSPSEQQALLAQARTAGQKIASDYTKTMRDFTQGNIRTGFTNAAPRGRYGQPLTDLFPQSTEAVAQRNQRIAPVMATTGFSEMQREQAAMMPPAIRSQSLFGGMGYASSLGGPQPVSPMLATGPTEQRSRRRIFGTV